MATFEVFTLVSVQLETSHLNEATHAWYAYVKGDRCPTRREVEALLEDDRGYAEADSAFEPAIVGIAIGDVKEVPNKLSRATKLYRFYAGSAG